MKKKKLIAQAAKKAELAVLPIKNDPYKEAQLMLTEVLMANVDGYYVKIDHVAWDPYNEDWGIDVSLCVGPLHTSHVLTLSCISEQAVEALFVFINKIVTAMRAADAAFTEVMEGPNDVV